MYLIPVSLSVDLCDIQPMILVSTAYLSVDHEGSGIAEDSNWHDTQSAYFPVSLNIGFWFLVKIVCFHLNTTCEMNTRFDQYNVV